MATLTFTATAVIDWLKLPDRTGETDVMPMIVTAVTSWVDGLPDAPREPIVDGEGGGWTDATIFAAIMFAARLYKRRGTPSGVEAFTEAGATYVAKYDPDVARILRLDTFAPPRVG